MNRMRPMILFSVAALLALPCQAQTTCFTDRHGTTLCSTSSGVVNGNTNSIGNSTYRDDRGNLLDSSLDPLGNAAVELSSGESINWSQSAPAQQSSTRTSTPGASVVSPELNDSAGPMTPPANQ